MKRRGGGRRKLEEKEREKCDRLYQRIRICDTVNLQNISSESRTLHKVLQEKFQEEALRGKQKA